MRINRGDFLRASAGAAAAVMLGGLDPIVDEAFAAPPSAGSLTVWGFQGAIEGVQSQVQAFKSKHSNTDVTVRMFGYDDIHTNLLSAITAGSGAPDLASIDVSRLASYVHGLTALNAEGRTYAHQVVPPTSSLASYRGNFYGLVTDSEPMGFLYRKDLWEKYGLRADRIHTWNDLATASDQMFRASHGSEPEWRVYGH